MSAEKNQIKLKLKNQTSNKKTQKNLYSKSKTISEKNDYYDNIISVKRKISFKKNNTAEKNKANNEKTNKNKNQQKSKNDFISLSDLTISNEQILDNNNYVNIIHTSIIERSNSKNYNKIKSVDANNYFNKEHNSITSFNDIKLNILNKKYNFNNPFIFCRNGIDYTNTKNIEEEKNYQIKRYRYLKCYKYSFNDELHRQNAKIIQIWWKKLIRSKIIKRKKAIIIQKMYRGYITRKHLNDIICISVIFQNFINKLRKVFTNFVRRNYFPKRYYKKKYAFEKIFPLKLKVFLRKWIRYKNNCKQKEKASENMIKIREKNRNVLYILKSFFHIWKLKCEKMKQNENGIKSLNNKEKKYRAIGKLFNSIEKISNKKAFNLSKNNLRKYLIYIFKNKYAKKLFDFYKKYNRRRIIKKYFDKWRNSIIKENEKNLKIKILSNEIKNQMRINDKEKLRNNFNNLRTKTNLQNIQNLKRAKEKFIFPQGIKHIINCVRKKIIRSEFKNYIRRINILKKMRKIMQKRKMKYYLKKWQKITRIKKNEENRKDKLKKLILILSHIYNNKKLSKYLFKWKSNIFINKFGKKQINIYGKFIKALLKYINNKNKPNKKYILTKIKNFINPKSKIIQKKLTKITNNFIDKTNSLMLRKVMNKWKKFVEYQKLNNLKARNLEAVARLSKAIYNSKKISQNLYNWKEKNNLMKLINKNKLNNNINELVNCLKEIRNRKMKLFFNCITKAKINLLMKIIIKNINNNHIKKILKNKFNQWKLNSLKKQNIYKLANINKLNKLKTIIIKLIQAKDKSNFGSLKKALFKWYLISKLINIENYNIFLKNIKDALYKIKKVFIKYSLKEPMNKIKNAKVNNKNLILKRLKKYFIKSDKDILRNAFIKFFAISKNESKRILKANILFNLKQKYNQLNSKILLVKYFNKWKLLNNFLTKEKIISTKNIISLLYNSSKKMSQKYSFDKLKCIKRKYHLIEFVNKLFKFYQISEKRALYNILRKWKNKSKNIEIKSSKRQKGYEIIYNTLTKAFSRKNGGDILSSLINQKINKNYKFFWDKFKLLYLSKIHFNFSNSFNNTKTAMKYHFEFNNKNKSKIPINNMNETHQEKNKIFAKNKRNFINILRYKKNNNNNNNNNIRINIQNKRNNFYNERLIPSFVSYLNTLRLKRLQISFEHINILYKNESFCKIFSSWKNTQTLIMKKDLLNSFKNYIFRQKILDYMRKSIINKLTSKYLVVIKRRNDLFILVHITRIKKRINQLKRSIRYVKIWRLYLKLLKEREEQLRKMERSFSQTYELLSDNIFVDKADEKSVQTQMMTFVDKVNYGFNNMRHSTGFRTMYSLSSMTSEKNEKEKINNHNNFQKNEISNFSEINQKCEYNNEKISKDINNIKSSILDNKNNN